MERVKKSTQLVLIWSTLFGIIFAGILIIFMTPIMKSFSKNDLAVMSIGSRALLLNAIVFVFFGFQAVYSSYFMALGKAKEGGLISIGRQGLFFIPLIFLLTAIFGLEGIIWTQPLADVCSLILVIILVKKEATHKQMITA